MIAAEVNRGRFVYQPGAGRVRDSRLLGVILAAAILIVGLTGLIANVATIRPLLAPIDGWPELKLLPSTELVLVGATLLALLRANRNVALPIALLASAISLGAMAGTLGAFRMPSGGMALSSALIFSTVSIAMLIAIASPSARDEARALGIAGFVVVALVATMLGAMIMGVLDPVVDSKVAGSSLQTLLAAFALGAYWLGVLWSSGRVTLESADWLPAGVGFASLLAVLVLWRALTVRETVQLHTLTQQAGDAQLRAMSSTAHTLARSLMRAAERHAIGAEPAQQVRDLEGLQRDVPGLESSFYAPVSSAAADTAIAPAVAGLDAVWRVRTASPRALADSAMYWPLDSLTQRFAIVAPTCVNGRCDGAVIGVVGSADAFNGTMADTTLGFYHALGGTTGRADSARRALLPGAPNVVFLPLQLGDVKLQMLTWPTATTISRVRSILPDIMLTMGVLLSGLLLATTKLGQGARRLARSREKARLASVLERSTDGIWEWDLMTGAAEHSSGIWQNLGYAGTATLSNRDAWMAIIHPDDVEDVRRSLARHFDGDTEAFEHEYRVRGHNGEWHTMVDRARIVERSPTGQPMRLLGVRADVTEARHAHSARLLNERRFRAIFDSGFQYQLLLDLEGRVLEVNRVAVEACRTSIEAVVGQQVWATLWWASTPAAREPLKEAIKLAVGGNSARYEAEVHCDDGPTTTLEVALKPFLDRSGQTNQLLLEARDITVRRRAEAALQEVDTLTTMGRVAARVAHEINNPLAGIQNSFLLIKGAVPPTHPHFAYVGAIEREIDRIAAVTRQLYETYRPEQDLGGGTSVRSLVADAVSFLVQVNRGAHVRIETDFANVPSVIHLPSQILRQIVYNLAQNAIEASPPGQLVSIRAHLTGSTFHLSVRDRGAGVPAELRDRIFDPFFSTKDRGVRTGGMGLGLALVRRTVTAAGGTIVVDDPPDGGSVFTVTLPVPSGGHGDEA